MGRKILRRPRKFTVIRLIQELASVLILPTNYGRPENRGQGSAGNFGVQRSEIAESTEGDDWDSSIAMLLQNPLYFLRAL